MRTIGIFEAKTKLSEICEEVAASRQAIVVTRRGQPLVRIDPLEPAPATIRERRESYMAEHGKDERKDREDFSAPPRSREAVNFEIEDAG